MSRLKIFTPNATQSSRTTRISAQNNFSNPHCSACLEDASIRGSQIPVSKTSRRKTTKSSGNQVTILNCRAEWGLGWIRGVADNASNFNKLRDCVVTVLTEHDVFA